MSGVFVSYRRDDSQGYAGRIAEDLGRRFGPERVFSDVEIPFGSTFGDVLRRAIAASDAVLVVIGRRWIEPRGDGRAPRLFDADDWVRLEIEAALAQDKALVPVLVGGATMPSAAALPDSIRRLTQRQAAWLDDRHWDADLAALAARLSELVPTLVDRRPGGVAAVPPSVDAPRRAPAGPPPQRPPARPGHPPWYLSVLLRPLWRVVRRVLTIVMLLALVYAGLRLFGDAGIQRGLDALDLRRVRGWQRALRYVAALMP
jgi:hypothetical protein